MWFGCDVNDIDFATPFQYPQFDDLSKKTRTGLSEFLETGDDANNILSGGKIMNSYFPEIKADIFISHSHKDIELAKNLAGYLHKQFGLISFIDSMVWGYSTDLQKYIDDEYCSFEEEGRKFYSYSKRNLSTSYVHMMLAKSLAGLMDNCACLFFINTEQSIRASEISEEKETFSPWIFYELDIFHKLEKRCQQQISISADVRTAAALKEATENFKIALPAATKGLKPLNRKLLNQWTEEHEPGEDAIIELYYYLYGRIQYRHTFF